MPNANAKLLVVDDEESIRISLSHILAQFGYEVRSAEDGFTALTEIRKEIPDILVCDLNMPGMSGFELLSVVRRRFPDTQVIAMSAAFAGEGVPPGVAADAYYEKGAHLASLLQIVRTMADPERSEFLAHASSLAPIWIPRNGRDASGDAYVIITCPECLRTFPQVLSDNVAPVQETDCVYCFSSICYAVVQAADGTSPTAFQRKPGAGVPSSISLPNANSN
jgi:CheY-like chemotaxis protein